ncbi:MAG TPA: trypsin-like peptidase domain-containing protein [Bryobacteraceae bacterium]|nr:trypsin-like peptidase domain-containing protein [Bryobacteraceae bacterium]
MALFQGTLHAGATISNPNGETGVAGIRVLDFGDRDYILTCAHVVAPPWDEREGAQIDTPAKAPGKAGESVFGSVHSWSRLRSGFTHPVDAALVKPFLGVRLSNEFLRLPAAPHRVMPDLRQFLAAPGAPSQLKIQTARGPVTGTVRAFTSRSFLLRNRPYHFADILEYEAQVHAGDSGSIVIDAQSRAVMGLHFAGIESRQGYCIPIEVVLKFFPEHKLRIAK